MKSLKAGEFIELAYGAHPRLWRLPVSVDQVLEIPPPQTLVDLEGEVRKALRHPTERPALSDWLKGARRVALVIPDTTRHFPYREILTPVIEAIEASGLSLDIVTAVVAHGLHSPKTPEPPGGWGLPPEVTVLRHDCRDPKVLAPAGKLSGRVFRFARDYIPGEIERFRKDPWNSVIRFSVSWHAGRRRTLLLHKTVMEADRVILAGTIVPHNIAGFSGGAKMLLPGVADEQNILLNHALRHHPNCRPGLMRGNPAREEMDEVVRIAPPLFIVNAVYADSGAIAVVAGDPILAHREGAEISRKTLIVRAKRTGLVVSSIAPPASESLYQLTKAAAPASRVVQPGGVLVLAGSCSLGYGDLQGVKRIVRHGIKTYLPPDVKVFVVTDLGRSAIRKIRSTGLAPLGDLEDAVRIWRRNMDQGGPKGVTVIPDAGSILPYVAREEDPNDWI